MENRLGYFVIETPDVEKARAFYAALFGWTFDENRSSPTGLHVQTTDGPAFSIAKGEKKDFSHLSFQVADVDAACGRIVELGGRAAIPSDTSNGRSAVVCDDQAVNFTVWTP